MTPSPVSAAKPAAIEGRLLVQLREPNGGSPQSLAALEAVRAKLAARWAAKGVRKLDKLLRPSTAAQQKALPQSNRLVRLMVLEYDEAMVSRDQLLAELAVDPDVLYAEPDYIVSKAAVFPNDSYFAEQWALHNTGQTGGSVDADIDAPEAWQALLSAQTVLVAVLDTGVDAGHEDLLGRVRSGYDFIDNDSLADDDNGHGTHVAGLIAARMNNATGIAGVAANAEILPVRVLDRDGFGGVSAIISGLQFAVDQGARVINLSLSTLGYSQALANAVASAQSAGCLLVAAMGNEGSDQREYPAAFPAVVGVGATDDRDELAFFSNFGDHLDLVAPGLGILSTYPGQRYAFSSGTSMATPIVAGAAALAWGANPLLSAAAIANLLNGTADDQIGLPLDDTPGWDRQYGWGRLNLERLLAAVQADIQGQTWEGFESGGLDWLPWSTAGSPWQVDYRERHNGVFAARPQSGMNPAETAELQTVVDCRAGVLGYWSHFTSPSGNDQLELWIDGVRVDQLPAAGEWTYRTATVSGGSHAFLWRFVKGGSAGDGGQAWLDDVRFPVSPVPEVPIPPLVFSPALSSQPRPVWTWLSVNGAGQFRYRLDLNDFTGGAMLTTATNYLPMADLADGPHVLFVQEQDGDGYWSAAGFSAVLIDTQPPTAPVVTGPAMTGASRPTWSWAASGDGNGQFRYWLSPGFVTWQETTDTAYTPDFTLPGGSYTLEVQERDEAGNWSASGSATVEIVTQVRLFSPNGGELYLPGEPILITWLPIEGVDRYLLQYTVNGRGWKRIAKLEGVSDYLWTLPPQKSASDLVQFRLTGYQGSRKHSVDVSDGTLSFAGSAELASPVGGETLTAGDEVTIDWLVRGYADPIRKVIVKYTTKDMRGWKKIAALDPNPDGSAPTSLTWLLPLVDQAETACRIMVLVQGRPTAKAISPATFTILPAP